MILREQPASSSDMSPQSSAPSQTCQGYISGQGGEGGGGGGGGGDIINYLGREDTAWCPRTGVGVRATGGVQSQLD